MSRASLYENTNGVIYYRQFIGAHTGTYNEPLVDKCCSILANGQYAGVTYNFHSDSAGNNPVTPTSFVFQFVNDPSFG